MRWMTYFIRRKNHSYFHNTFYLYDYDPLREKW